MCFQTKAPRNTYFNLNIRHPDLDEEEGFFFARRLLSMNNGELIVARMDRIRESKLTVRLDTSFTMDVHIYVGLTAEEKEQIIVKQMESSYNGDEDRYYTSS